MLCAKFVWNWSSGSWRRRFSNSANVFSLFHNYLPLEKGVTLDLKKLDSLHPRMLCAKSGWIGPVVLERRFLNFVIMIMFSLFRKYLPLEIGVVLYFKKLESPSPKDALCQVWLKLAHWFLKRRWKWEKFTDRRLRREGRRTTGDQKSSLQLRWAKTLRINVQ